MRLFIALILISLPVQAAEWLAQGRRFVAPDALVSGTNPFREVSERIGEHLSRLHDAHFADTPEATVISFEPSMNVDAVFYPAGRYEGAVAGISRSNVIVVNPRLVRSPSLLRLVGHEYFHVIHWAHDKTQMDWVREGLAQLFEKEIYGGISTSNLRAALTQSRHALEESFDVNDYQAERYGNAFLFFHFMKETCDAQEMWNAFFHLPPGVAPGRDSVQSVLRLLRSPVSECNDVRDLMSRFVVAKLTNQRGGGLLRALWPELPGMPVMSAEARSLSALSFTDQRRFFEALPPFLGLKLPLGSWVPTLGARDLTRLGIRVQVWRSALPYPTLSDWEGERPVAAGNSYLLIYKSR